MNEVKSIAIDLDGTILEMDWDMWVKHRMNYFGKPKPGAIRALTFLRNLGYKIIIHTCRINTRINPQYTLGELWLIVEEKLTEYGIPYDEVWIETGKPIADYYIDDRALYFSDWDQAMKSLSLLESFTKEKSDER